MLRSNNNDLKRGKFRSMARSPKVSPALEDEVVANGQLSLFAPARAGEIIEMVPPKAETKSVSRTKKHATYSAADIQVLEGIAAIRHRPGMYIGSTSTSGLLHLIWEALDNAVDEARGMPFDPMLYQGDYLPAATVIFTVPHSGGKFEEGAYKTAGGLHGVGATIINALSEKLELTIWKDGQQFTQAFSRGTAMPHHIKPCDPKLHGTQLHWLYDRSIFDADAYYSLEAIESRLKAEAYLNRGVSFHLDAYDDAIGEQIHRDFYSR